MIRKYSNIACVVLKSMLREKEERRKWHRKHVVEVNIEIHSK